MTDAAQHAVIIGAGLYRLSAAYELAKRGIRVTVLEKDGEVDGLLRGEWNLP